MNYKPASPFWQRLNPGLFPLFEDSIPDRTPAHMRVIATLDFLEAESILDLFGKNQFGPGRPPVERALVLRAFIAKAVLGLSTTVALIDRLKVDSVLRKICGWVFTNKIPCEATFSNCFQEFSDSKVLEKVHLSVVTSSLQNDLIFHVSRDSTAIEGHEKVKSTEKSEVLPEKETSPKTQKRGRPKKGEIRPPKPLSPLETQQNQSLRKMLAELDTKASYGAKLDSHGNQCTWAGYKLHLDVCDGGVPLSCLLTSASVHDSRVSLPLQALTTQHFQPLYLLADKAYDSKIIRKSIENSGMVPIIPQNQRRLEFTPSLTPPEKRRFKQRSTVERANSALKERFGAGSIWVKGHKKVMCHIMFGILALTADTLIRLP